MTQQAEDSPSNEHSKLSDSYRLNSEKEVLILKYVENFRRQYHHIYGDRKGLLLYPSNECGTPVGEY